MDREKLQFFKELLLKKREDILREVAETIKGLEEGSENLPDAVDQATRETNLILDLRLRDRDQKLLKKIDKALQKIEDGSYGICEACGVEIGEKRLMARPETTLCIDCKRAQERLEKIKGE